MINTLGYPPGSVGYNMEGAKAIINAKGGELTPLAKMYDSKGYTLPPTSSPEPTIGSALGTGGFDRNAALNTLNQAEAQLKALQQQKDAFYGSQADTAGSDFVYTPYEAGPDMPDTYVDEEEERRRIMRMFQGQIDATNQVYDQLLREARMEGEGRLGSQRAIGARSGILGSDFAGAQKQKVQDFNTDIYRSINAERRAAIAAIEGEGRRYAAQEIAAKRAARQQDAETYLNFLANKETRTNEWVSGMAESLLAQGLTPDEVEDTINRAAQDAGVDPMRIKDAFYKLQAASAGAEDTEYKFFSGSGGLYRTNPKTGEVEFVPGGSGGSTSGDSSTDSTTSTPGTTPSGEVPTLAEFKEANKDAFDALVQEWVAKGTDISAAKAIVNRKLQEDYEVWVKRSGSTTPSLKELTPSNKGILEQAGLNSASGDVQTFYLNAPSDFQKFFARAVVLGNFDSNVSADELQEILTAYEEEKSGGGREL